MDAGRLTDRLYEHLATAGFTREQCAELADLLTGLPRGGDHRQAITVALLEQQGIAPDLARVVARAIPLVDWGRLLVAARTAWMLLGVSHVSLYRYRREDKLLPAVEHRPREMTTALAYWLPDILYVLSRDDEVDVGQGKPRLPWA